MVVEDRSADMFYSNIVMKQPRNPLAVIVAEIPQAAVLFFPDVTERPTEAPVMALEKKQRNEELQ